MYRSADAPRKTLLAPGFENRDGHRVRQVQAAIAGPHRQAQTLCRCQRVDDVLRQAPGLRTEQQRIARQEIRRRVAARTIGLEGVEPRVGQAVATNAQRRPDPHRGEFAVIETGAAQAGIIEGETQRFDQVQRAAGVGAEPDDVARVRRNLGFVEDDVKQRLRSLAASTAIVPESTPST